MKKLIISFIGIALGLTVAHAQTIDCSQQQNLVNQLTINLNSVNSDLQTANNNLNTCLNAQSQQADVAAVVATPAYQAAVAQANPVTSMPVVSDGTNFSDSLMVNSAS